MRGKTRNWRACAGGALAAAVRSSTRISGRGYPCPLGTAVIGVVLAIAHQAPSLAQDQVQIEFNIPSQPLDSALRAFSEQSRYQVLFEEAAVEGRRAPALIGRYSPREGLGRLLANSGVQINGERAGVFTVKRIPADVGGAPATHLAPVHVTARAGLDATSEGSGTYAAGAVTVGKGDVKSLREIPQSVSVITRQQIEDQNMTTVNDALMQTPGVIARPSVWGYQYYYARGYSMATSYDGVAVTYFTNLDDLASVDRVETLRGPAALMRGSGSTGDYGGIVNIVKKRPLKKFGVAGSASIGSWNNFGGDLDITTPINEAGSLRGRVVVAGEDRDFYYAGTHRRKWTVFGTLEADLTPRTTLTLAGTYQESRTRRPYVGVPRFTDGRLLSTDRSTNVGPAWGKDDTDFSHLSAELVHRFDNEWKARATLLYRRVEHQYHSYYNWFTGVAPDGTATFRGMYYPEDNSSLGLDASVSGPFSLLGRTHRLTLGVELNRYSSKFSYLATLVEGRNALSPNIDASDVPTNAAAAGSADIGRMSIPQQAAYGVLHLKPLDSVTVIGGARVTNYLYKTYSESTGAWTTTYDYSGRLTPYGGVVWDLGRQVSLYGSYTEVFIPQTAYAYPNTLLPPRIGWQGEFGIKGEFLDGRLNGSLAIYRIRDTNRPMRDELHNGCGGTATGYCYLASGLVQSQGVDAEVSGSPMTGLLLTAGYSYNQNKYLRDTTTANVNQAFLSYSPRHSLKLWATYDLGAHPATRALANWRVGMGAVVQSAVDYSSTIRQGGFALLSAQVGYRVNAKTSISVSVNNLADRFYLADSGYFGEPRNIKVVARSTF